MLSVGASKTGGASAGAAAGDFSHHDGKRGVEVRFDVAKAGPGIHASVPTGPVIDGRGRWRRRFDRHVSRKSQPGCGKAESSPGKTGYELVVVHCPVPDS